MNNKEESEHIIINWKNLLEESNLKCKKQRNNGQGQGRRRITWNQEPTGNKH